ncbi:hypothetical protein LINPERHAP2_LOCUS24375 [Linum perenne]
MSGIKSVYYVWFHRGERMLTGGCGGLVEMGSKGCWEAAGLRGLMAELESTQDFKEWLFKLISLPSKATTQLALGVMWSLWAERNRRVWENESRAENFIIKEGKDMLDDWKVAQAHGGQPRQVERGGSCGRWHAPIHDRTKINVDGALFNGQRRHGVGAVLRGA